MFKVYNKCPYLKYSSNQISLLHFLRRADGNRAAVDPLRAACFHRFHLRSALVFDLLDLRDSSLFVITKSTTAVAVIEQVNRMAGLLTNLSFSLKRNKRKTIICTNIYYDKLLDY